MKKLNPTFIFSFLIVGVVIGCTPKENATVEAPLTSSSVELIHTMDPELDQGSQVNDLSRDKENLFGTFYQDRVSFYIIPAPDLVISGAQVSKLTLYYIDDILYKKKYELETNIASQLMNEYGSFKFKALNFRTKELSKSRGVILHSSDSKEVNSFLDHYQMKWGFEDKTIVYLHRNDSLMETNHYIEELLSYQKLLKAIPKG